MTTSPNDHSRPSAPLAWEPTSDPVERPWLTDIEVVLGTEERPDLLRWSGATVTHAGSRDAYAVRTPEGLVLVDPDDPAPNASDRLGTLLGRMGDRPIASVLSYVLHERASARIRAATGAPVWAPRGRRDALEHEPDHLFGDGAALPGGIRAVTLTEMHTPPGPEGDSFLLWRAPAGERVLFSYDRIVARVLSQEPEHAPLIGRPGPLLWLRYAWLGSTPEEASDGEARFRAGLRRLLSEPFDLVCPGHGALVLRDHPRQRVLRVLEGGRRVANFVVI